MIPPNAPQMQSKAPQSRVGFEAVVPFDYLTEISLGANATGTNTLVLDNEGFFELHYMLGMSSADGLTDVAPNNFKVQMMDGSRRYMSNALIPQRLIAPYAAQGGLPEPRPVIYAPNSVFQFNFLNLVADTNIITIVLKGYKLIGNQSPLNFQG